MFRWFVCFQFSIGWLWLHRVLTAARGLCLVAARGLPVAGAFLGEHGLCCSAVGGLFLDQGSNPCPLHWQQSSRHQTSREVPEHGLVLCGCVVASPSVPRLWAGLPEAGTVGVCSFNPLAVGSQSENPWGLTAPPSPQPRRGPGSSTRLSPLLGFADPAGCGSEQTPAQGAHSGLLRTLVPKPCLVPLLLPDP